MTGPSPGTPRRSRKTSASLPVFRMPSSVSVAASSVTSQSRMRPRSALGRRGLIPGRPAVAGDQAISYDRVRLRTAAPGGAGCAWRRRARRRRIAAYRGAGRQSRARRVLLRRKGRVGSVNRGVRHLRPPFRSGAGASASCGRPDSSHAGARHGNAIFGWRRRRYDWRRRSSGAPGPRSAPWRSRRSSSPRSPQARRAASRPGTRSTPGRWPPDRLLVPHDQDEIHVGSLSVGPWLNLAGSLI